MDLAHLGNTDLCADAVEQLLDEVDISPKKLLLDYRQLRCKQVVNKNSVGRSWDMPSNLHSGAP